MSQFPSQGLLSAPLGAVNTSEKQSKQILVNTKQVIHFLGLSLLVLGLRLLCWDPRSEGMLRREVGSAHVHRAGRFQLWEMHSCETMGEHGARPKGQTPPSESWVQVSP